MERELKKFLDTKLQKEQGKYITSVSRNRKIPTHWSTKIPKKLKRNIVTNDLHRAKRITTVFEEEVKVIKEKFQTASYPPRFVDSIVKNFEDQEKQNNRDDQGEDEKPFILIRIPYCGKNEIISKQFLRKIQELTASLAFYGKLRRLNHYSKSRIKSFIKLM